MSCLNSLSKALCISVCLSPSHLAPHLFHVLNSVTIAVNNVSVRYDHPQYFALVPHQKVWQIMNMNISAVTMMSHMLLPQMLQRGKGAIINVCSVAACTPPIPLTAEYTASIVRI